MQNLPLYQAVLQLPKHYFKTKQLLIKNLLLVNLEQQDKEENLEKRKY